MPLKLITPPATDPVDLALVKQQHLRVLHTLEDGAIGAYIKAATDEAQRKTGRQFVEATYELILEGFLTDKDNRIYFPKPPLKEVVSVKYSDLDNEEQTIDPETYYVEVNELYGYIEFTDLPSTYSRKDAVRIQFKAGYGTTADVPESLKQWVMIRTANFFEFRQGAEHSQITDSLLFPFMLPELI